MNDDERKGLDEAKKLKLTFLHFIGEANLNFRETLALLMTLIAEICLASKVPYKQYLDIGEYFKKMPYEDELKKVMDKENDSK